MNIGHDEALERERVLGWLQLTTVVDKLATTEDCWRLGRLVAAGNSACLSKQE